MKAGFVSIFGKPNAGKSTLLNALMGEKLAIVSSKVQTTRHRIKGIVSEPGYQLIISDTPGIIDPQYKLHERMMSAVKQSLEDADLAVLLLSIKDSWEENDELFSSLSLKVPALVLINKIDLANQQKLEEAINFFSGKPYASKVLGLSALHQSDVQQLLTTMAEMVPEGQPFYDTEDISDLPTKFFVAEMVREKIYSQYEEEIPYQATVLVQEFKEKDTLTKIRADIIVQRESQKAIIIGAKGAGIKKLGMEARKDSEAFLQRKVFLELFVKVRPKWRENDLFLKEYGY